MGKNGTRTVFRTCPLCEATCGLEIAMDGRQVVRIRGDRDDVFSHGFICPKGSTLKQLQEDPDRLRRPQIRRGSEWKEVSWDDAFAEVQQGLEGVWERHGREAVAIYLGNPNVHNLAGQLYLRPLIKALGTNNRFSASSVDQLPKHVSAGLMFGGPLLMPIPDLDRTDHLLMLGANPYESNGSLCTAPDFPGRLEAIQERGGKVVVVDPRRSKTAAKASEHVSIRPGTDAHLLCAIAQTIVAEERVDVGRLAEHLNGLAELPQVLAPFTPDAVAPVCGIDADTIRRMARELCDAEAAAVYGRIGTHTAEFGTIAAWAVDVVNVLTGNLDRPGGAMFPLPAAGRRPGEAGGPGWAMGRWESRVKGFPERIGEFPVATLADEIETPGQGQVRALVTVAGNPVLSTPNSGRLDAALASLEFMVSVDVYRNETSRHADVILPPPSPLERSHYDIAFYGLAVRNVANWSPPVLDLEPGMIPEAEILARLALIAAGQGSDADPAIVDDLLLTGLLASIRKSEPELIGDRDDAAILDLLHGDTAEARVIDLMLRAGPYGEGFGADPDGLSLEKLESNPHGIDFGALEPRLPEVLDTESGCVELTPQAIVEDLGRLAHSLDRNGDGMVLVGRRHVRSNNSWMHNIDVLMKGKPRCTLQIHPDDAARLGVADGGTARVTSRVGTVEAPVEITPDIRVGVVSLPHGWGHDVDGTSMSIAAAKPGVNSNVLTDETAVDALSGNAVLNAIPVDVEGM